MSGIRTSFVVAAVIVAPLLAPIAAFSLDIDFVVPTSSTPKTKPAKHAADDVFVDLDLSSAREVVPAALAFQAEKYAKPTVVIPEGENLRTVSKNCMLTASEYFALRQIMQDDQQLQLRNDGTSSGGTVSIDKYTAEHCRNLYVPRRVVAFQDTAKLPELSIPGELHVAGIYDIRGSADSATLKTKRFKLYPGGTIGTTSPDLKVSIFQKSARNANVSDEYILTHSDTTLVKADDEFIPSEGTEASVEIGVLHQQRESCQLK